MNTRKFLTFTLAAVFVMALAFGLHQFAPQFAGVALAGLAVLPFLGTVAAPDIGAALGEFEKSLKGIDSKIAGLDQQFGFIKELPGQVKGTSEDLNKLRTDMDALRKQLLGLKTGPVYQRKAGHISNEAARCFGAHLLLQADAFDGLKNYNSHTRDTIVGLSREILGITSKTALTSSDIPLPVDYSGEIVELVSEWGAARKYGTMYPLGAGSTKLPRLKTDPTFGLIASSGTVTEKSPQSEWVTFTAEKFGGLVRLPSEIDADSIVAMGQFLARYIARQLAYLEDYNFFAGTGAGSGVNGSVEGLAKSTITNGKVLQQASTKTKYSDITLANMRAIRAVVDAPVIGHGAYYMHPTFEQALSGLNTAGDKPYIAAGIQGASLDGFPIRWIDSLPAYSTSANVSKVYALFGDVSFQYLGLRGGVMTETSRDVFFATDELAVRGLERFTIGLMALGSVAGLQTAAS